MIRAAIIDQRAGAVINVVEYASLPVGTPPGFPDGTIAVESATADTRWTYESGELVPPPDASPPPPPPRYFLAEDFVRLVAQLPSAAQDAILQARLTDRAVDGMWSLMLSKGQRGIDAQGTTFGVAWTLLSAILMPIIGTHGLRAFRAAISGILRNYR